MKNTAMQRILLFLLCISIWLIYLLQKELAAYGIYTVIPYRISEVMSLIPKLGILTAVIWFLCLCLQKEKQLPDKIFLVVLLAAIYLQGMYIYNMGQQHSITALVEVVSVDEFSNTVTVRDVNQGKAIELESPMIISNILEKQEYWITYSADDRDASKGKLRMIR